MQREFDYYMAQKLLKKLREADLISEGELDKITAKNFRLFSSLNLSCMREIVLIASYLRRIFYKKRRKFV